MAVYVNNITVDTGSNFFRDFYLDNADGTPLDLTGYTGKSEVRKHPDSVGAAATFTVSFIDRTNGRFRLSLDRYVTEKIKPGRYSYDVLFTDSSNQKSIVLEGMFNARPDYTPISECTQTVYTNKFGFISNDNQTVTASGQLESTTVDEITLSQINNYGVVILGYADRCGTIPNTVTFIQNNIDTIENYIRRGGVIWFRGEHAGGGCAPSADQNAALAALGTNIRVRGTSNVSNTTTNISGSTVLPATLNHSATNGLDGGIALYETSANGVISVAYQKIGNGVVFVNADVNGDFTSPSDELYEGIRDLVTAAEYTPTVTTTNYNPDP